MKPEKLIVTLLLILLTGILPSGMTLAAPNALNYQGSLTDSGGSPVPDQVYNMVFRIYDAATGGTLLYEESQTVTTVNGTYNVLLGTGTPTTGTFDPALFSADNRWLEVEVNAEILTPRQPVTSVAFSLQAEEAAHAAAADDATTLAGQPASDYDQSTHVTDTSNPHNVTAAQTGAATPGDIATHAANTSAHHTKTTSFTELTGTVTDAQIPATIARDSEIMTTVLSGDGTGSGLDADTLDGQDGAYYTDWNHLTNVPPGIIGGTETDPEVGANTLNYIPLWDGSALVSSPIYYNGNQIVMGSSSHSVSLSVYNFVDTGSGGYKIGGVPFLWQGGDWTNLYAGQAAGHTAAGHDNVYVGTGSGQQTPGSYNTFVGGVSGFSSFLKNRNTFIGYMAGYSSAGDGNVFLGHMAGYNETGANKLYISNTDTSTPLIYGEFDNGIVNINGNLGVGTATPGARLEVTGQVKITGGTPGAGKVLTSDAGGLATWQPIPNDSDWTVSGNDVYSSVSGNVGIGTSTPSASLHVAGNNGVLFEGTLNAGAVTAGGSGGRMLWYPRKFAFRAGSVGGTQWDDANIGLVSIAMGSSTQASGMHSTALGSSTTAGGREATAMGRGTSASGRTATAMGSGSAAEGDRATAIGNNTTAQSFSEVALGSYNTTVSLTDPTSPSAWFSEDRLLVVGNGASAASRSDALVILKNGFVGLGVQTHTANLEIAGQIKIAGGTPGASKILTSDATGLAHWETPDNLLYTHNHDAAYVNDNTGEVDDADINIGSISPNRISGNAWTSLNDGPTSGLNADLLDGYHSGAFAAAGHNHDAAYVNDNAGEVDNADIVVGSLTPDRISGTAWTSTNDGPASGMEADLLDGKHASAFADASHNHDTAYVNRSGDTMTGALALPKNGLTVGTDHLILSGGDVGIGTPSPARRLHVAGGTSSYGMLRIENSNTGANEATIGFKEGSDALDSQIWVAGVGPWANPSDFVIGRGVAKFLIEPGGDVGIGTSSPFAKLHVSGSTGALFEGTFGLGALSREGAGTRMLWYPGKAAFRAGEVSGTHWDDAQMGDHSVAMGSSTTASGSYSTALGHATTAGGNAAFAVGTSGFATGDNSAALGNGTKARSFAETVIGNWNEDYTPASGGATSWQSTDRLFVVGNGTGKASPSNALTILKNGKIGIGTSSPKQALHNTGDYYGKGHIWLHAYTGDGTSGTAYLQARDDSGTSSINLQLRSQNAGALVDAVMIKSDGRVGIGTTAPTATLDIAGTTRIGTNGTVMSSMQSGTATLGVNTYGGKQSFSITFPNAFYKTPPSVTVTVRNSGAYTDVFAVSTTNVTTTGFDVTLYRVDVAGGSWGQTPFLDWIAIEQ